MYNAFFGFERNPFASKPDRAFFYRSKQHDTALRSLLFAVQARMGLVALTGEEGTGKTTVLECLHDTLKSNNIQCAFLRDARVSTNRFFQAIGSDLDLRCQGTSAYQVFSALHQLMIEQARKGGTVALIVDEAHNLPGDVFNEILHFATLHDDKVKLLQTVLGGRPELQPTLDALNLERLKQRAVLTCTLRSFSAQETKEYIEFRLAQAGTPNQTVFSTEAIAEVHDRSRGLAPAIHALCESLLLAAFSARSKVCTQEILDQVFKTPHGSAPAIQEAETGPVLPVPASEPEPAPLCTAWLRPDFDPIPSSPMPLGANTSKLSGLQSIALGPVLPTWNFALPATELAVGLKKPMRLAEGARFASVAETISLQIPVSLEPVHPAADFQLLGAGWDRTSLVRLPVRSGSPAATTASRKVLQKAIHFAESFLRQPKGQPNGQSRGPADEARQAGAPRIPTLVPLEGYLSPKPPLAAAPASGHSLAIPCVATLKPKHPAAKLQASGTVKQRGFAVTPFRISQYDPSSPINGGDVQMHPVHPENPVRPAIAGELIASREPNIRERNHPLPLTGSVPPSPPPPATPIKTISNILPPLEAWCPPSNLEPVNPRTAFLLLPSWRPADPTPVTLKPAFRETGKPFTIHKFPAPKKWLVTLAIPILAGVALFRAPATVRGWQDAHQALLDRAAVALHEDFRAGLDDWMNREGARPSWTSDAAGFVHPGALGLYRPSLSLADYQMQFVGTIDKKELSWVVRAADFNNYYEIRLAALKPGRIGVTRYAVINGKIQNRSMTPLAISAQPDTVYRVRLEVRGDQFALSVQDRLVDSWSEPQLRHGGIGFFSEPDAGSRVAGLQVRGHDDILGHLCAFLAPSGVASYRASLNQRAAIVLISGIKASSTAGGDLNSSLAGSAGRRQRGVRLDPAVWQAPEIALTKSRRCQPATTRAGGARVRHIPSGSSSSAPCY